MSELVGRLLAEPIVATAGWLVAAVAVAVWLAACWWAYQDASRRSDSALAPYVALAWVFLSGPVLLPISAAIYGLVRPQESRGDRRARTILASIAPADTAEPACPVCRRDVDGSWIRCPACAAWLVHRCPQCERFAPIDSQLCPWCAWSPGDPIVPAVRTLAEDGLVPAPASTAATAATVATAATAAEAATVADPPATSPGVEVAAAAAGGGPAVLERLPATQGGRGRLRFGRRADARRDREHDEAPGGRRSREREAGSRAGGPSFVG